MMPLVSETNKDIDVSIINNEIISKPAVTYDITELHHSITNSRDKLFFISYIPDGTMIWQWYLVQVDMCVSDTIRDDSASSGYYLCNFLAKHPSNTNKSDEFSRPGILKEMI